MTNFRRIIFLDIDGVILPLSHLSRLLYDAYPAGQVPDPRRCLVQLLDQHPDIELVLSSSWRLELGIELARNLLPVRLRHRLIDETPALNYGADRGAECLAWLGQQEGPLIYAALDDCAALFDSNFKHLVLVNERFGLVDDTVIELKKHLALPSNAKI